MEITPQRVDPTPMPSSNASKSYIQVVEVQNKSQLKDFLQLPRRVYTDPASHYVMPLEAHMKMMMGKLGTPKKHFFLAYVNGEPVARLGVKVHTVGSETRLHFGFFECQDKYPDAAKALIDKAHSLYPELEMIGPFNFRQEDPYVGILVEGFQHRPYFLMPYNSATYDSTLKNAGMQKAMDLFTYEVHKDEGLPQLIKDNAEKARREFGLSIRTLDPKKLHQEARAIARIFNEALSDNWGFEEFLDDQINEMVMMFKFFIDPQVVAFAQKDGRDIGCLLMIPDYNHLIKASHGKLGPGLVWRYLTRARSTNSIRGYALGVLKEFQGKGVGSFLTDEMYRLAKNTPYGACEISWVLANNSPMNELAKAMGGKQNKVYRIYEKPPLKKVNA